jgi:hypothetical protein
MIIILQYCGFSLAELMSNRGGGAIFTRDAGRPMEQSVGHPGCGRPCLVDGGTTAINSVATLGWRLLFTEYLVYARNIVPVVQWIEREPSKL